MPRTPFKNFLPFLVSLPLAALIVGGLSVVRGQFRDPSQAFPGGNTPRYFDTCFTNVLGGTQCAFQEKTGTFVMPILDTQFMFLDYYPTPGNPAGAPATRALHSVIRAGGSSYHLELGRSTTTLINLTKPACETSDGYNSATCRGGSGGQFPAVYPLAVTSTFYGLCADIDGCGVMIGMKGFDAVNPGLTRTAGPYRLLIRFLTVFNGQAYYIWNVARGPIGGGAEGRDNQDGAGAVLAGANLPGPGIDCDLTDADSGTLSGNTVNLVDDKAGFALQNKANTLLPPSTLCVLDVFD